MSIMDGASATGWVRHGHWTDEQWVLIGRYSIRSIWYLLLICISLTRYFLLTCFWYIMVRKQQLPFFRKERDWVGSTAKSAIAKHLASYWSLTKCMHIAASISLNSKPSVTQSVRKIEHQKNEIESRFSGSSERGNSRSASSGVLARSETDIQVSTNTALCTSLLYLTFAFVILCLLSAILYLLLSADIQVSTNTTLCTSLLYFGFDFVIFCLPSAILYFLRSADFHISPSTRLINLIPTDDKFDFKS